MITYVILATLLTATQATCPATQLVLPPGQEAPTEEDLRILEYSKEGCRRNFGEDSCLTKLVKREPGAYRAYCAKLK